ncbi:MAG: hypothetical protein ACR2JU_06675 [Nocardioidaceae bacterium]
MGPTEGRDDEVHVAALDPVLVDVLESAARLQRLVPDAILVGGSAAASYAGHRLSFDHDHVVADLRDRFEMVLDALESEPDWVTNKVVAGKIVLGRIGDIEAGVRQLIRKTALEFQDLRLPSGATVRIPTLDEVLRVKAFLMVKRNQVRDYLDVAALADRHGASAAADVLVGIDSYYADETKDGEPVSSQVLRQLGDPRPADHRHVQELDRYKGLAPRWQDWSEVRAKLREVAAHMSRI